LKVSQNTICQVNRFVKKENSGYATILKDVEKNESGNSFAYLLGIIDTLLPPPRGSNWKEVRKEQYRKLRDLEEKPF